MTVRAKSTVTSIDPSAPDNEDIADTESASEAADAADEQLTELELQLRVAAESLKHSARALGDVMSKQIQAHPLASFGVAFVAGVTAAKLLRR